MPDLIYVGYHWTDDYLICDDCKIEQRIPSSKESPQVESLPNYYRIVQHHAGLGHKCYVRSRRQKWPPDLDRQASFRIALRQAGPDHEAAYYA